MTDSELVKSAKSGDTHAFEQIVKNYESQVAATVIGMLGQCQAAEDVGQEVFIRFYKYLNSFREEATVGTYLTRIAINLCLNELKRRKRRQFFFKSTDDEPDFEIASDETENMEGNENQAIVQHAIKKLEPNFRSVIVLRLIKGYSTEETAQMLKVPLGTVLSRLSRAQKKLKEHLAPYILEEV